jgi:hypothetical protein
MRGQYSQWCKGAAALAFCFLLGACDNNDQAKKANEGSETIKRETALMSDPNRAGPELEKRLAESVSVDGGLLLVHTITGGLYVLPVSTPWTLNCWCGMSIVFGNSVTGDDSNTTNDVTVNLTVGQIDQKNLLAQ